MHIRDELELRIYVALLEGPLSPYEIIKIIKEDGGLLSPIEERTVYRKLPKMAVAHRLSVDTKAESVTYRLEAKTRPLLKAHLQHSRTLLSILSSRLG